MRVDDFLKKIEIGNYEISINSIKMGNPAELLEKLHPIKEDDTLTNQEKIERVRKIINEYME
ncbi:MAG TPA: hypothetical protein GXX36_07335 [Clostridiaceae bacterium]|nr:hypothetical protein [Clostridiaceae bacterium]